MFLRETLKDKNILPTIKFWSKEDFSVPFQ
jgi:hypothetical protein